MWPTNSDPQHGSFIKAHVQASKNLGNQIAVVCFGNKPIENQEIKTFYTPFRKGPFGWKVKLDYVIKAINHLGGCELLHIHGGSADTAYIIIRLKSSKYSIFFALGKAYDDLKDSEEAIKFLTLGNKMMNKNRNSNITEEINITNEMKNAFENIDLSIKHKSFSNKKIIFICGMPRSGTTLVEQIISSHNKVYGAGELPFLSSVVHDNFFNDNKLDKKKIAKLQNSPENLINDQYFEKISLFNFDEHVLTDKALINFKWIGFIKIFFPNSKIIHCKRDPKDNCLSIYKNNFSGSNLNWAFNQKDISNYYNNYNFLMKFWYSKIPEFIHTIEYEKLVSDKKNEIEKLLEFCELELDDNCFNHHKNTKTQIKTVSISQARQAVYSSSVRSSDKYKNHLKEMFENLI